MDNAIQKIKEKFGIIGNSKSLNRAIEVAIQVAPTDMSVVINGESGSGKESFSKIIHSLSKYKHGKFIALNCGAIPEGTIDSELFGHEKGAFTGAENMRKGYFEEANNGTIFLDEIAEMPFSTQSRLLRVLEQRELIRVGSSKVHKINVRVIAATNVDLMKAIQKKKFREDLYYRLNTVPIIIPPLRERKEDIILLFKKFALDFSMQFNVGPARLTDEAEARLLEYNFPGNIRELKNITNQISVLEKNRKISKETLEKYLPEKINAEFPILSTNSNLKNINNWSEKEFIYKALLEMKHEIDILRKIILDVITSSNVPLENISTHEIEYLKSKILGINNVANQIDYFPDHKISSDSNKKIIKNIETNENLSIENKEKELVKKALVKNNHKRKLAAKELGISERTLYRKIKHFKLDE